MDKIVCIGKNYHEHVKELAGLSPRGEAALSSGSDRPIIFLKPPSILQLVKNQHTGKLKYPIGFGSVHFESEIVLRIARECYKVSSENAHKYFDAVSIGLDMTLRDLQTTQKKSGMPWTTSKVFPDSAVCGEWLKLSEFQDFDTTEFSFTLNDVLRQTGKASQMIWSCAQCVSHISQYFKLLPGDMVYTGTPAGVGSVKIGDMGELQYHHLSYKIEWVA